MIRTVLLLSGAFSFAYPLSTCLHEVGHVAAAWATGGVVREFVVHPFSSSYVEIEPDPAPLVTHAAGVLLGPAVAVLAALLCPRRAPSPLPLLLGLTAACACAASGIYVVIGTVLDEGDPATLMQLGWPAVWLVGGGVVGLCVGLVWAIHLVRHHGFHRSSLLGTMAIVTLAVAPYLLALVSFNAIWRPYELSIWGPLAAAGLAAAAMVGALSWRPGTGPDDRNPCSWQSVAAAWGAGVGLVAALLVWTS
jgi:hypothetical protein